MKKLFHIKIAFFITLFFGVLASYGQDGDAIVKLNAIINNPESDDTSLVKAYVDLSEILYLTDLDTVVPLCKKAKEIAETALESKQDSISKARLQQFLADAINNIGYVLERKGRLKEALEYYHQSLKIKEELGDKNGQSTALNNIGLIQQSQNNMILALDYFEKSLALREELNFKWGIAQSQNNIGKLYMEIDSLELAQERNMISIKIREEIGDKNGIAQSCNNIGLVYYKMDSILLAKQYYNRSLDILMKANFKEGMPYIYINLARIELDEGTQSSLRNAFEFATNALDISRETGIKTSIKSAALLLSNILELQNKGMDALQMHKLFSQMKDSIVNDENRKMALEHQAEYEYEKQKAIDDKENEKRVALEYQKQKNQFIILIIVIIAAAFIFILLLIIYRRLKLTKAQKQIIEETNEELNQTNEELAAQRDEIENQKNKVEEAHQEIKDSIIYAKRIQEAILPSMDMVTKFFPKSFILYKPKDVVAGDFYWQETFKDKVFIAAADCTGHGVPGAMVSVICSNALSKALLEDEIAETGKLLDRTRELVIERLAKSEDIKDGMDISLACFDFNNMKLEWAGANNPLYLLRNGEIIITKGDKEPIGFTQNPTPFTEHSFDLLKEDIIYLFTDGYPDQFGGEQGKKMGYKNFRDKLKEISNLEMEKQNSELETYFDEWKRNEEQVDDVCVIGVKI